MEEAALRDYKKKDIKVGSERADVRVHLVIHRKGRGLIKFNENFNSILKEKTKRCRLITL